MVLDTSYHYPCTCQIPKKYLDQCGLWIMLGLTALLAGFFPSCSGLTYVYLGLSFLIIYIGSIANLPDWTTRLTPYGYIPSMPQANITSFAALSLIAAALTAAGFISYRRRDLKM